MITEMFVRHRWETGETVKGSQRWQMGNRGQRTGKTAKNSADSKNSRRGQAGIEIIWLGPKPHNEVRWDMHEHPSFVAHTGANLAITVTQLR